ncbi:MAG: hypothetical protein EZS28_037261, partial [Streblomastix strix]
MALTTSLSFAPNHVALAYDGAEQQNAPPIYASKHWIIIKTNALDLSTGIQVGTSLNKPEIASAHEDIRISHFCSTQLWFLVLHSKQRLQHRGEAYVYREQSESTIFYGKDAVVIQQLPALVELGAPERATIEALGMLAMDSVDEAREIVSLVLERAALGEKDKRLAALYLADHLTKKCGYPWSALIGGGIADTFNLIYLDAGADERVKLRELLATWRGVFDDNAIFQ